MRKRFSEDLTVNQIGYLLVEKRRAMRAGRLEHFHYTGRVMPLFGETNTMEEQRRFSSVEQTRVRGDKASQQPRLDRLLVGIESLAIIGLVSVVMGGLSALGALNRTVAAALLQPTLEPTPMIREVVLPDGHTPPDGLGGARPNEAEIPLHLHPL